MAEKFYIQNYCHIKSGCLSLNSKVLFENKNSDTAAFLKLIYRHLQMDYPKFFKMDQLSKLAFLGAEVLLKKSFETTSEKDIAIIFSNRSSSLDTDRKHQLSISEKSNYYPSPSVFVYTLPNICIGEICIRHSLFSENSFFIFDAFNAEHLYTNTISLLKAHKAKKVLCGWIDLDQENYHAFLYCVGKNGDIEHSIKDIKRLFNDA